MEDLKSIQKKVLPGEAFFLYYAPGDSKYIVRFLNTIPMSMGCIIVLNEAVYNTTIRYLDDGVETLGITKIIVEDDNKFSATIASFCKSKSLQTIRYTHSLPIGFCSEIIAEKPEIQLIDESKYIDSFLLQKDEHTIAHVRASASLLYRRLSSFSYSDFIGKTQEEMKNIFFQKMLSYSTEPAFLFSIACGDQLKETTVSIPTSRIIEDGEPVVIDTGFIFNGYYTDITRMFFSQSDARIYTYKKLEKIQKRVIDRIKAGTTFGSIVSLYKAFFDEAFKDYQFFPEDLGHSIGYSLHENPIFVQDNEEFSLLPGMIITLEPEILVDGYRYRIEDMVLIGENQCEILTK